jgi:hypothetical protein
MFASTGLGQKEDGHIALRKLPDDGFHRPHTGAQTFDERPPQFGRIFAVDIPRVRQ